MKITSAIWLALGLSWASMAANENATVYYWTDAQGVTHFSDTPVAGKPMHSKQIEIINPPTTNPNPLNSATTDAAAQTDNDATTIAYTLSITAPQSEQSIRDNEGRLAVQNQLTPEIAAEESAQLMLYVDANPYPCSITSLRCEVSNIARGAHQLRTELVSKSGKILASSETITVYLFRVTAIK